MGVAVRTSTYELGWVGGGAQLTPQQEVLARTYIHNVHECIKAYYVPGNGTTVSNTLFFIDFSQ